MGPVAIPSITVQLVNTQLTGISAMLQWPIKWVARPECGLQLIVVLLARKGGRPM